MPIFRPKLLKKQNFPCISLFNRDSWGSMVRHGLGPQPASVGIMAQTPEEMNPGQPHIPDNGPRRIGFPKENE
jgi:hypothetical protein